MKAPTQASSDYTPAPEGNQVGILVGLYYFGVQPYTYKGEEKMRHECRVVFELPNAKAKFGDSDEERPYMVGKNGTYSMNEKSFLRKVVEACHGKKLAEDEAVNFEIESVVGKPCLVNISHYESNGNTYAGIDNVSAIPSGMTAPERTNPTVVFDINHFTQEQYDSLPEWMRNKVINANGKPITLDDRISPEDRAIKAEDIPF